MNWIDLLLQKGAESFTLWCFRRLKTNSFWLAKALTWVWFVLMITACWLLISDKLTRDPNIYFLAGVLYTGLIAEWAYLTYKSLEYDEKRAFKAHSIANFPNPKKRKKLFRLTASGLISIILAVLLVSRYMHSFAATALYALSPLSLFVAIMYLSTCNYLDPEKVEDFITHV